MRDELDENWIDVTVSVTKMAASLLPLVGGAFVELISETIPRQRQERIIEYLRQLKDRVLTLEEEHVTRLLSDKEGIDLIESGAHLAVRATTSERIARIAEIVFRGLSAEETNFIRRKRLLGLFGDIDDDEFMLLKAYGESGGRLGSDAWEAIDRPPPAVLGSSRRQIDEENLFEIGNQNLLRLGLLERKFGQVRRGEYPEFDPRSGGFKSHIGISYLGRMLLREVGIDLGY